MKDWLVTKGPAVGCFKVYDDFYAYRSGVYRQETGADLAGTASASSVTTTTSAPGSGRTAGGPAGATRASSGSGTAVRDRRRDVGRRAAEEDRDAGSSASSDRDLGRRRGAQRRRVLAGRAGRASAAAPTVSSSPSSQPPVGPRGRKPGRHPARQRPDRRGLRLLKRPFRRRPPPTPRRTHEPDLPDRVPPETTGPAVPALPAPARRGGGRADAAAGSTSWACSASRRSATRARSH